MTGDTGSESHPVAASLMAAGMIVAILFFWWYARRYGPRKTSDWDNLSRKFPATDAHKFGGRYKNRNASFGNRNEASIDSAFLIEFAREGFLVTPNFAKTLPILIPWAAIREVRTIDPGFMKPVVLVNVEHEKRMCFHLPEDALATLQQNVPADRFRAEASLFEVIKDRWQHRADKP